MRRLTDVRMRIVIKERRLAERVEGRPEVSRLKVKKAGVCLSFDRLKGLSPHYSASGARSWI